MFLKHLLKGSQPILEEMLSTKTGTELYKDFQQIPTDVVFDLNDEINNEAIKKAGAQAHQYDMSGYRTNKQTGLYFGPIIITPDLEKIKERATSENIDDKERFLQVMSIELGHFSTSNQINIEENYDSPMGSKKAKEAIYSNQKRGSQIVGEGSLHEKLKENGRASELKTFKAVDENDKIVRGNAKAEKLQTSIGKHLEKQYNEKEGGVNVYGLSVLDGYHSMIVTYGKNEKGKIEFNLFDQGPATSFWSGNSTFETAEKLDEAINNYIKSKQDKRTKNGSEYPANAQIFKIINDEKK